MSSALPLKIVHAVITALEDRSGFDAWWGEIDHDVRVDIEAELADVVERAIREGVLR